MWTVAEVVVPHPVFAWLCRSEGRNAITRVRLAPRVNLACEAKERVRTSEVIVGTRRHVRAAAPIVDSCVRERPRSRSTPHRASQPEPSRVRGQGRRAALWSSTRSAWQSRSRPWPRQPPGPRRPRASACGATAIVLLTRTLGSDPRQSADGQHREGLTRRSVPRRARQDRYATVRIMTLAPASLTRRASRRSRRGTSYARITFTWLSIRRSSMSRSQSGSSGWRCA